MEAAKEDDYGWLVGIDWATDAHEVCVMTSSREIVSQRKVEHSGPAIAGFIDQLAKLCAGKPERVAVSIEIPRGAVVESLAERGFHVYAINPKQLDRFRDRHTVAGAKDDRRDAFVLADSLRTDRPCFRKVRVDDPLVIQLREMSRVDDDLAQDMNRLTNRMREQLHRLPAATSPVAVGRRAVAVGSARARADAVRWSASQAEADHEAACRASYPPAR